MKNLSSPLEKELFHGPVFRKTDGAVVGVCGLPLVPHPLQKVSADSPVRLIIRDSSQIHSVENREASFGSVRFGNRSGVSRLRADRWRYPEQLFVEQHDRRPIGPAGMRPLGMYRLNCGFQLKSPRARPLECLSQMVLGFLD